MISGKQLFFLAFLEGLGAMAIEVLGGKMLSPYFGSSLYIWTSVIGITLLCLTIGYYLGGILSRKPDLPKRISLLFNLTGVIMIGLPLLSNILYQSLSEFHLFLSCTLFALFVLGPPLIMLGAISPLIIQLNTPELRAAGSTAGKIYALSTLGGIIATFSLGFFLIPSLGVRWPLFIMALLILVPVNLVIRPRVKVLVPGLIVFSVFAFLMFKPRKAETAGRYARTEVYVSEGMMGQLKVIDFIGEGGFVNRALMTNNSPQSIITKQNATALSQFNYVHFLSSMATLKPQRSSVLLFGMAGASLVYELQQQNFNIDVVDIDERMFYVSQRYFYFQKKNTNLFTDDARHFMKTAKKKYDIVIIDISSSEVQPSYLYTVESFSEIKKLLNPGGLLFVNFQGMLQGDSKLALATWSLYHTLRETGYHTYYFSFHPERKDDVQFIASPQPVNFKMLDEEKVNVCCTQNMFVAQVLKAKGIDSTYRSSLKPMLLTDDIPKLEKLKFEAVTETRMQLIKQLDQDEFQTEIKLYR